MKKMTVIVLATLSLVLTGCSNDDDKAKESLSTALTEQGAVPGADKVAKEDADCASEAIVDDVGTDKLQEYGVLNDELEFDTRLDEVKWEKEDAESVADAVLDCLDVMDAAKEQMSSVTASLPEEQRSCVEELLTEEKIRELLVSTLQQDGEGMQALQEDMMACAQP